MGSIYHIIIVFYIFVKNGEGITPKQGICDIVRGMNTGLILLAWGAIIVAVVAVLLKTGILTVKIERRDENEDKIEEVTT